MTEGNEFILGDDHKMIRAMKISDAPRAAEIHVFGWRSSYKGFISNEFLFNNMIVSERVRFFENAVRSNLEETYVFDDGIVKAILTIGMCRDLDKSSSFELWGIYIDPFMKKQGIGATMVDYCENMAIKRGCNEICLWVFEKNVEARFFYEALGYYPDGTEKFINFLSATEIRYCKML